jgi:hypothetical protein
MLGGSGGRTTLTFSTPYLYCKAKLRDCQMERRASAQAARDCLRTTEREGRSCCH